MKEEYKVLKIYEDDFGCEERSEDYEPQVIVIVKDMSESEIYLKQSDAWMYEQDINEGDKVILVDGRLKKL